MTEALITASPEGIPGFEELVLVETDTWGENKSHSCIAVWSGVESYGGIQRSDQDRWKCTSHMFHWEDFYFTLSVKDVTPRWERSCMLMAKPSVLCKFSHAWRPWKAFHMRFVTLKREVRGSALICYEEPQEAKCKVRIQRMKVWRQAFRASSTADSSKLGMLKHFKLQLWQGFTCFWLIAARKEREMSLPFWRYTEASKVSLHNRRMRANSSHEEDRWTSSAASDIVKWKMYQPLLNKFQVVKSNPNSSSPFWESTTDCLIFIV